MNKFKIIGAPSRTTPGAVGDIYIDMETGLEYRCTFAYRDPFSKNLDCEWTPTGKKHRTPTFDIPVVKKDPPKEIKEVKENEEVREPVKNNKSKYVNYSKHLKKVK